MTRITIDDVTSNPGAYSADQWNWAHGIDGPDYEGCSAYQYGLMSGAARRRRDAAVDKARAEQDAGHQAYHAAIIHEWEHNPSFVAQTRDAQRIVRDHIEARDKAQRVKEDRDSWRIENVKASVKVGDIVEYRAGGKYEVVKVNPKSVMVKTEWAQLAKFPQGAFRLVTP